MSILVTGATGNVGGAALRALRARGIEAFGTSSRPFSASSSLSSLSSSSPVRELDFLRPETFVPALRGIDRVLLVRPPALGNMSATLLPFIDAALAAGVGHFVFLSVVGAAANPLLPHTKVEKHLAARGAKATFLRAGFFAQNLTETWRADVVQDGRLLLPAGDARIAFVDARDLGEAAANLVTGPIPTGCVAFDLTGSTAVTVTALAALVSAATDALVVYERCSALRFLLHLWRRRRLPLLQAFILTLLHVGLRKNDERNGAARITDELHRLLQRPPVTMAAFVDEHRALLRRGPR